MKKAVFILFLIPAWVQANWNLSAGLRLQKSYHWYWENGVTIDFSHTKLFHQRLHFGVHFLSSSLGSAWGTNAIRQEQYLLFGRYLFLHEKKLHPFIQLNAGYLFAHYDQSYFSELDNDSPLLSVELGILANLTSKMDAGISVGYNAIYGDGLSGAGTIYPLIYQFTIQYRVFQQNKENHETH